MPELPEVETIRSSLEVNLKARITTVEARREDVIKRREFPLEELVGLTITGLKRRGKYLILGLDGSRVLVVHLGMSGRFYMLPEAEKVTAAHVHFIIHLDNGNKLIYQDPRRFGKIWLCQGEDDLFDHMGVEPLSRQFSQEYLTSVCAHRKVAIKTLLLNQNLIAGLGNIYADEALFKAGIRGTRPAGTLSQEEIKRLRLAIVKVLRHSIRERGTTFRDFRDGYNRSGGFQNSLAVYGRTGQSCHVCGGIINKEQIGGRSSHYCENCQK